MCDSVQFSEGVWMYGVTTYANASYYNDHIKSEFFQLVVQGRQMFHLGTPCLVQSLVQVQQRLVI